jgi:hypothetical protein
VVVFHSARKFTGEVKWVEIDLGLDDHNHLIRAEDRVNLAMAFQ